MKIIDTIFGVLDTIVFGTTEHIHSFFAPSYYSTYYYNQHGQQVNGVVQVPQYQRLKIKVHHKAHLKLQYYTKHVDIEWGGMMVVSKKENLFIVEDILFLPQRATHGDFHLDLDKLGKFLSDLSDTNPSLLPKIRGWAHSHHTLGTFWSSEDDDTFKQLCDYYGDYAIGVVVTKDGKQLWRIDIKHPSFGNIRVDDVKYEIVYSDKSLEKQCIEDINKNLKRRFF